VPSVRPESFLVPGPTKRRVERERESPVVIEGVVVPVRLPETQIVKSRASRGDRSPALLSARPRAWVSEATTLQVVALWCCISVSVSRRHQARGISSLPCSRLGRISALAETGLLGIEATEVRASVSRITRVERGIARSGSGRPRVAPWLVEKSLSADESHSASPKIPCMVSYRALSVVVGCRSLVLSIVWYRIIGLRVVVSWRAVYSHGVLFSVLSVRKRKREFGETVLPATEHRVGVSARLSPASTDIVHYYC